MLSTARLEQRRALVGGGGHSTLRHPAQPGNNTVRHPAQSGSTNGRGALVGSTSSTPQMTSGALARLLHVSGPMARAQTCRHLHAPWRSCAHHACQWAHSTRADMQAYARTMALLRASSMSASAISRVRRASVSCASSARSVSSFSLTA